MDMLIEFILGFVFDAAAVGAASAAGSSRVPKPVRYLILTLILLFYEAFFVLIFGLAFLLIIKKYYLLGIIIAAMGAFLLFISIRKFRRLWIKAKITSAEGENKENKL